MDNQSNSSFDSNFDADAVLQTLTESVSGLIRTNIYRTLQELPDHENAFIRKEDIDKLVDSCLGVQKQTCADAPAFGDTNTSPDFNSKANTPSAETKVNGKVSVDTKPNSNARRPHPATAKGVFTIDYKQMVNAHCKNEQLEDSAVLLSKEDFPAKPFEGFAMPLRKDLTLESLASDMSEGLNNCTLLSELERNKLLVENFNILETRLNQLECRISEMLQTVPHVRECQRQKFTINKQAIRNELQQLVERAQALHPSAAPQNPSELMETESQMATRTLKEYMQTMSANTEEVETEEDDVLSAFEEASIDEFYYERRQNLLNRLYFKKSAGTMALHQRRQQTLPYNLAQLKYPGGRNGRDGKFPYFLELSERAKRVDFDEATVSSKK